jgi:hypothetical protein
MEQAKVRQMQHEELIRLRRRQPRQLRRLSRTNNAMPRNGGRRFLEVCRCWVSLSNWAFAIDDPISAKRPDKPPGSACLALPDRRFRRELLTQIWKALGRTGDNTTSPEIRLHFRPRGRTHNQPHFWRLGSLHSLHSSSPCDQIVLRLPFEPRSLSHGFPRDQIYGPPTRAGNQQFLFANDKAP